MRFTIRWLLAATAYVALVAAAYRSNFYLLMDSVWAVVLFACCYAVVTACMGNGKRRAMAIGFVTLAAMHIATLFLIPYAPESRLRTLFRHDFSTYTVRVTNGVVTLGAGMVGCLLGGLAYKHAGRQT